MIMSRGALKASIAKWKDNVLSIEEGCFSMVKLGRLECPLCELHWGEYTCAGCPVWEKTGLSHCEGTPYNDFVDAYDEEDWARALEIGRREVEFLESCL